MDGTTQGIVVALADLLNRATITREITAEERSRYPLMHYVTSMVSNVLWSFDQAKRALSVIVETTIAAGPHRQVTFHASFTISIEEAGAFLGRIKSSLAKGHTHIDNIDYTGGTQVTFCFQH